MSARRRARARCGRWHASFCRRIARVGTTRRSWSSAQRCACPPCPAAQDVRFAISATATRAGSRRSYPSPRKRAPRARSTFARWCRGGSRVLLARRKTTGLFGGLWEPPMVELRSGERPEASFGSLLGTALMELRVVGEQTHLLTHRKLRITITTADIRGKLRAPPSADYDRFEWRGAAEQILLGMSSLAKKVLLACPGPREPTHRHGAARAGLLFAGAWGARAPGAPPSCPTSVPRRGARSPRRRPPTNETATSFAGGSRR